MHENMKYKESAAKKKNSFDNKLATLPIGEGIVLDKEKIAAYHDDGGEFHIYSAVCTHLGCTVTWNPLEKSFDCPCHGSRFSAVSGNVINGPANNQLEPKAKT
jgi:Rieske Fe-S protein